MYKNIKIFESNVYAKQVAQEILIRLTKLESQNSFLQIALAGGSTPKQVYKELSLLLPKLNKARFKFFLGDERFVPLNHAESNYKMIKENLLNLKDRENFELIPVNTELGTNNLAAEDYDNKLKHKPFDLIILGMGEDGHTASLFPNSESLSVTNRSYTAALASNGQERISLTKEAIQNASEIIVLITGEAKSFRLSKVLNNSGEISTEPIRILEKVKNKVTWYLDNNTAQ